MGRVLRDPHDILDVGRTVAAEYEVGTAPRQDQVHLRAFVFDYLTTHATGMLDWTTRTRSALDEWPRLNDKRRRTRSPTDRRPARTLPPALDTTDAA